MPSLRWTPSVSTFWYKSVYLITELIHELLVKLLETRYDCWYFVLLRQDRASEVPCSRDLHSITQLKSNRKRVSANSIMLGTDKDHQIFHEAFEITNLSKTRTRDNDNSSGF